jgi:hypothetical protein
MISRRDRKGKTQRIAKKNDSECKLGLLINFNTVKLKDGIQRIVNNL